MWVLFMLVWFFPLAGLSFLFACNLEVFGFGGLGFEASVIGISFPDIWP